MSRIRFLSLESWEKGDAFKDLIWEMWEGKAKRRNLAGYTENKGIRQEVERSSIQIHF